MAGPIGWGDAAGGVDKRHPRWCAGDPLCTAYDESERFVALRQHRGPVFSIEVAGVGIELQLRLAVSRPPTDVYLTAVARAAIVQGGMTLSVDDGWRLLDAASGLLEQVR